MTDWFISYTLADRPWAEWIYWNLETAGYKAVVQFAHFTPGSNFVLQMHRALSEAKRTVAILSPDYLTSLYANAEWAAAFVDDPAGEHARLIPIRVKKCRLRGLLKSIVYLDLVGLDEGDAQHTLIDALTKIAPPSRRAKSSGNRRRLAVGQCPPFPGATATRVDGGPEATRLNKYTRKIEDLAFFGRKGVPQEITKEFYRRILAAWYDET